MKNLFSALALASAVVIAVPAAAGVVYSNGPIKATENGYEINDGWQVTDSFTLSQSTTITGFDFGGWASQGDAATQVDYGFSSSPNYAITGTANLTKTPFGIAYGYDVSTYSATIAPVTLAAGTYWFSLQNAVTTNNGYFYWDESDGPSGSFQNQNVFGTTAVPSHAFTLYGSSSPAPEPASWALMLGGFGMIGGAMRSRRKAAVTFA